MQNVSSKCQDQLRPSQTTLLFMQFRKKIETNLNFSTECQFPSVRSGILFTISGIARCNVPRQCGPKTKRRRSN